MNLDKKPDGPALEAACLAYQRMIKAHGKGYDSAANQSASVVKAFCSEFGFTPASRTRLALNKPPEKPEDDLLKALSAPREPRPAFVQ
jgi:phage terminase small subunit